MRTGFHAGPFAIFMNDVITSIAAGFLRFPEIPYYGKL